MTPVFAALRTPPARIALGIGVGVLALGAIVAWFAHHDRKVIQRHEVAQERDRAQDALGAERNANSNSDIRQATARQNEEVLHDVQRSAETLDPAGAHRPVGPATGAVIDELRRQRGNRAPR